MKRTILFSIFVCSLFLNTPAYAQTEVVSAVKNDLVARHVSLTGPCGAFEITKRVAWILRAQGFGLLSKPGGTNCQGYSVDFLVRMDGSGVDILGDAGNDNIPVFNESEPPGALLGRWVPAFDPGDSTTPVPNPGPIVPTPGTEPSELLQRVITIEQVVAEIREQNSYHEAQEAFEREQAKQFRDDVRSVWKDRVVFLSKYVAPILGGVFAGWKLQ